VCDIRLAYHEPSDFQFPLPNAERTEVHFVPTGLLPDEADESEGVVFLDELANAPRATQSLGLQLALDRAVGKYKLPAGYRIVAASNRLTDRAGTNPLISSLAARFLHIYLRADVDEWSRWALMNDVPTEVVAFIRFRQDLLHAFDANQTVSPNPRGWTFVGKILERNLSAPVRAASINGIVGTGAGTEFAAFLEVFGTLPSAEDIIMDPAGATVPDSSNPSALYALAGMLAKIANESNFAALTTYLKRIPDEFGAFAFKAIHLRAKGDGSLPKLERTRAYQAWCIENKELVLGF